MAFVNKWRRAAEAFLAFAFTAVLVYFGNGLNPWWPLMWLAPLPILWFALRSSWWSAGLLAAAAWLAGALNLWSYCRMVGLPPVIWLGAFGIGALAFGLAVLLFRALVLRGAFFSAIIAFPSAWVTFEYVKNLSWPHATAGNLAYSQLRFLPFLQLASITGPWGMGFVLLLFPAGIAIALFLRSSQPKQAARMLAGTLTIIAAVLIFGFVRLALPGQGHKIRVGLIASDVRPDQSIAEEETDTTRRLPSYLDEAQMLVAQGAKIIVMPEGTGTVSTANVASTDAILQRLANDAQVTIVAGMNYKSATALYDQARIYQPYAARMSYNKHHLLPPLESRFTPGTGFALLPVGAETYGVEICKDMDYTPLSREYGRLGAGIMLVPGGDFNVDRIWHGHMAIMRGVEDGFSVVRAARHGYLTVSDDRGRILGETRSDSAPFATLVTEVPTSHASTVYQILGDWTAWLAIAILLLTMGQLLLPCRRSINVGVS